MAQNKVRLPKMDFDKNINYSPHVVILGAGASIASCPDGDKNGLKLPSMKNFIELLKLYKLLNEWGVDYKEENFELLYDRLSRKSDKKELVERIENKVYDYFSQMKLPDKVTLYDKIILSLRPKDLIATFNWDPFLAQAYKRNIHLKKLPQIIFLHGNVEIGICLKDKVKGYVNDICRTCGSSLEPTKLLYPITDKDYSKDPFIQNEWAIFEEFLENAYFITIFGYSAPTTDAEAVRIMKDKWKANPSQELGEIDIIDILSEEELNKTWKGFFVSQHFSIVDRYEKSYLAHYPRRSCEALAGATLMLKSWRNKPLPETKDLVKLQHSVEKLINEEINAEKEGLGFEKWT